ncbi:hypothetical protein V8D89_008590 [Ganoderma adspersum]
MAFSALAAAGWHPQTSWQGRLLDIRVRQLVCSAARVMASTDVPGDYLLPALSSQTFTAGGWSRSLGVGSEHRRTEPELSLSIWLQLPTAVIPHGATAVLLACGRKGRGVDAPMMAVLPILTPTQFRRRSEGGVAQFRRSAAGRNHASSEMMQSRDMLATTAGLPDPHSSPFIPSPRRSRISRDEDEMRRRCTEMSGLAFGSLVWELIRGSVHVPDERGDEEIARRACTGSTARRNQGCKAADESRFGDPGSGLSPQAAARKYEIRGVRSVLKCFQATNVDICGENGVAVETWLRIPNRASTRHTLNCVIGALSMGHKYSELQGRVRAVRPGQAASVFADYMLVLCVENTVEKSTKWYIPVRQLRARACCPQLSKSRRTALPNTPRGFEHGVRTWHQEKQARAARSGLGWLLCSAVSGRQRGRGWTEMPRMRLGRLGGSVARCTPAGESSSSKNGRPDAGKDMSPAPEAGEVIEVTESGATARRPGLRRQPVRSGRTAHVRVSHRVVSSAGGHADVTKHRVLRRKMRIVSRHRPETPRTFLSNRLCSSSSSRSATDGLLNAGRFGGARDSNSAGDPDDRGGRLGSCVHSLVVDVGVCGEAETCMAAWLSPLPCVGSIAVFAAYAVWQQSCALGGSQLLWMVDGLRDARACAWPGSSLDSSEAGDNTPSGVRVGMKGSGVSAFEDMGTTLARARARADDAGGKPTVDTDRLEELRMAAR